MRPVISIDRESCGWLAERHLRLRLLGTHPCEADAACLLAVRAIRSHLGTLVAGIWHAGSTLQVEFVEPPSDRLAMLERCLSIACNLTAHDCDANRAKSPIICIPACYHPSLAPDLQTLADERGCDPQTFARRHASGEYTVRFIGFSPGFAYMQGLARELTAPRLLTPRRRVPAGSIGVADDQCGIYPHETPGGWRLIGRTPLRMFDVNRTEPSLLQPGDRVRFIEISLDEFNRASHESNER